jgi:predicted DCC family thiol-disulfide oxidoreductase YuxK
MTVRVRTIWQRVIELASRERLLIGASVFRIVAGLTILYQFLINYHQRHYLYGPDAVWPYTTFLEKLSETRSFSLYAISPSPLVFELVFHLGLLVIALWVIGWHTRLMTLLTYIFVWSLHERNPLLWDGGDNALQIILVYAVFANLGAYFSLDADRLRRGRESGGIRSRALAMIHNAALLAFAIQLCLVYGASGLYKVQGKMWQSGTALYYIMRVDEFTWPGYSEHIYQNIFLVTALSYATVAFQVSFPFLFFLNRYTRRLILLAGLSFHLGIALFMGLVTFSAFLMSVELALIADGDYQMIGRWFTRRGHRLAHWVTQRRRALRENPALAPLRVHLFYDGWCPFCRQSIATLQRLDLLALLEPVSFREPGVLRRFGLDVARAEARLQARTASSTTTVDGIDAFTLIATRLPALWPTVPVLWAASRLGLGQRIYDWIAVRRKIIPIACGPHCAWRANSERDLQQVAIPQK